MEHTIKLHTRENGRFVVKTVATDKYFTVCPYQVGDDDLEEAKKAWGANENLKGYIETPSVESLLVGIEEQAVQTEPAEN